MRRCGPAERCPAGLWPFSALGRGWCGWGLSGAESVAQRAGCGSPSLTPAVKSRGPCRPRYSRSREGLDRARGGRGREYALKHRFGLPAGVRLGAREHPHVPCGVAEVAAHAPLVERRDGELEFGLGSGVHGPTAARGRGCGSTGGCALRVRLRRGQSGKSVWVLGGRGDGEAVAAATPASPHSPAG